MDRAVYLQSWVCEKRGRRFNDYLVLLLLAVVGLAVFFRSIVDGFGCLATRFVLLKLQASGWALSVIGCSRYREEFFLEEVENDMF